MRLTALLGIGILSSTAAFAGPTGLVSMPIADILGHREYLHTWTMFGTEKNIDSRWYHSHAGLVGLFDRAEVGFDNDFMGNTTLNAKVLLFEEPKDAKYALSAGTVGWKDGNGTNYVVGRYDFDQFRVHAGWLNDGENRLMVGIDGALGKSGMSWSLEHTTGTGARSWVGLSVPFEQIKGFSVLLGVGVPNKKEEGVQFAVTFNYGFKF